MGRGGSGRERPGLTASDEADDGGADHRRRRRDAGAEDTRCAVLGVRGRESGNTRRHGAVIRPRATAQPSAGHPQELSRHEQDDADTQQHALHEAERTRGALNFG